MKKEKNVFLTTLSETKNKLDVNYYMCESPTGASICTTGISIAEAGIKYMLSQYDIDEIVMIGTSNVVPAMEERVISLSDLAASGDGSIDTSDEFKFVTYRIMEFIDQLDFEIIDIGESVPENRQVELGAMIEDFKSGNARGLSNLEFFSKLTSDEAFENRFVEDLLNNLSPEEKRWVKHQVYHQMDSFYKMHINNREKPVVIRFVSIPSESTLSIDTINLIVRRTFDDAQSDINLYMDVQGMGLVDGNTLISTFLLMNNRTNYSCNVCGLINSSLPYGKFFGKVSNMIKHYEIQKLITGIDLFLNYGKVSMLKSLENFFKADAADADRLFYGMDCVDEGITLCNVDLIECGINIIRNTIRNPRTRAEDRSIYMQITLNAIISDFGQLLQGDELSIPELLKWSLRKDFFQQTLTIIESKVPTDMVRRGIYYYARSEEDIRTLMKEFNYLYWNESSKMRWAFGDIEYYFIKSYGRSFLDFRQKPDAVARDFARLKIDALHGRTDNILPAYSELGNDDMLFELLLGYYRIGNLRNQINHAEVDEPNLDADELVKRKDSRDELRVELKKFINLYSSACKKTPVTDKPVFLPSGRMKAYARRHQLQPLVEGSDLTVENTYTCSFNGKEVHITLSLFKPEPDIDVEE